MISYVVFLGLRIARVDEVSRAEQTTHIDVVPTSVEMAPSEKR